MLYACSGVLLLVAIYSIRRDRRRFRNSVLLGLTLMALLLALLVDVEKLPVEVAEPVVFGIFVLPFLAVLVLAFFLVGNGLTMVRREGRTLGNLLSLLAGIGILGFQLLLIGAAYTQNRAMGAVAVTALAVLSYVGFLFCCYLGYAFLYGRLRVRPGIDFVVVLGSRVIDGRVAPLLASRLDKGKALYDAERERGGAPRIITSGGQGPDEVLPEAHAMAEYLIAAGTPEESLLREDSSRTTAQNLRFSKDLMDREKPGYQCVVVTNNFHAFRAAILARKVGVNGQVVGSPTAFYYWPSATIREFLAIFLEHRIVNLGICGLLALVGLGFSLN